jgi:hypothetical protein
VFRKKTCGKTVENLRKIALVWHQNDRAPKIFHAEKPMENNSEITHKTLTQSKPKTIFGQGTAHLRVALDFP